jgi:large subunit ribosomal protein L9
MSKKRAVNVVLLEDLALRGFAGEEVAVKPGYARNFLIPGRKAVYATADNKAQHVVARSDEERGLLEEHRDFVQFKARATHRALTFTRKVTLDGTSLEQPLTKTELAAAVRKQLKRRVEETDIRLPRGTEVKVLGDLEIKVEVGVPQMLLLQEQQQQEGGAATAAGEKRGGIKEKREAVSVKVTIHKDETKRDRRVSGGADAEGGGKPTE